MLTHPGYDMRKTEDESIKHESLPISQPIAKPSHQVTPAKNLLGYTDVYDLLDKINC